MKGATGRVGLPLTFAFKSIRVANTTWEILLLVGREKAPEHDEWNDPEKLGEALWVGVVTRADYMAAVAGKVANSGGDTLAIRDAAVTVNCNRSWLGPYVRWWRYDEINGAEWWSDLVA